MAYTSAKMELRLVTKRSLKRFSMKRKLPWTLQMHPNKGRLERCRREDEFGPAPVTVISNYSTSGDDRRRVRQVQKRRTFDGRRGNVKRNGERSIILCVNGGGD